MAIQLSLNDVANDVTLSPSVNSIYNTCVSQVGGSIQTDDLGGDTILSIDILENTITATSIQINGSPASFPFAISGFTPYTFGFTLTPSGTVSNADSIKFTVNTLTGAYEFTYDFLEIDEMSAFSLMVNPNNLGTLYIGSTNTFNLQIDNQTCFSYDYSFSTDLPETTWLAPSPISVPYRSMSNVSYDFLPTVGYANLGLYSIFLSTTCISPSLPFAGQVIATPTISGVSKIAISNSISFS
jgi:hypothetical protein